MILQSVDGVISAKVDCTEFNKTAWIKHFRLNLIGPISIIQDPHPQILSHFDRIPEIISYFLDTSVDRGLTYLLPNVYF